MKKNLLLISLITGVTAACGSGGSSNNSVAPAPTVQYSTIHGYTHLYITTDKT